MTDTSNYMLGKYIMLAVNNPKKYPSKPVSATYTAPDEDEDSSEQMTDEDRARLDAIMGAFAQRANSLPSAETDEETAKAKEPENVGSK
jgi:hypothetical protein